MINATKKTIKFTVKRNYQCLPGKSFDDFASADVCHVGYFHDKNSYQPRRRPIFHTFSQIFVFLAKWTLKYKIEALEILTIIITTMLIIAISYCHLLKTYLLQMCSFRCSTLLVQTEDHSLGLECHYVNVSFGSNK